LYSLFACFGFITARLNPEKKKINRPNGKYMSEKLLNHGSEYCIVIQKSSLFCLTPEILEVPSFFTNRSLKETSGFCQFKTL